jgi:hypothetical protein
MKYLQQREQELRQRGGAHIPEFIVVTTPLASPEKKKKNRLRTSASSGRRNRHHESPRRAFSMPLVSSPEHTSHPDDTRNAKKTPRRRTMPHATTTKLHSDGINIDNGGEPLLSLQELSLLLMPPKSFLDSFKEKSSRTPADESDGSINVIMDISPGKVTNDKDMHVDADLVRILMNSHPM